MHLFLRSGIDPDTGEYAGCMKCDFDGYITAPNSTGMVTPVIFIFKVLNHSAIGGYLESHHVLSA